MTIDELVDEVKGLGLQWRETSIGTIRCARGRCPILAVYNQRFGKTEDNWQFDRAADALGLSPEDASQIVDAVDFGSHRLSVEQRALRDRFLKELVHAGA
jgi:hypothetical protein